MRTERFTLERDKMPHSHYSFYDYIYLLSVTFSLSLPPERLSTHEPVIYKLMHNWVSICLPLITAQVTGSGWKTQTSLSPGTSYSSFRRTPRHSKVSWEYLGLSSSRTCPEHLAQEVSKSDAWDIQTSSFQCAGVVALLWMPVAWLNSSTHLKKREASDP